MTGIKKTAIVGIITLILGLAGNFVKNKFSVFADDLGKTKQEIAEQKRLTDELAAKQDEIKKYVELNIKLTNDKIKLQKQYTREIERINNERYDKAALFNNKPGSSTIINSGLRDIFQNISSNGPASP